MTHSNRCALTSWSEATSLPTWSLPSSPSDRLTASNPGQPSVDRMTAVWPPRRSPSVRLTIPFVRRNAKRARAKTVGSNRVAPSTNSPAQILAGIEPLRNQLYPMTTDTAQRVLREPLAASDPSTACRSSRPQPPAIRPVRPFAPAATDWRDARSSCSKAAGRSWPAVQ